MDYNRKANRKIHTKSTRPNSRLIDTDTLLTFGKYKGKTPIDIIIMDDTRYLVWLFHNSTSNRFTDGYKIIAGIS